MLKPVALASAKRFKIGEMAQLLGVEPYVLRFWEEEFPMLVAARTAKGQRYYTEEHLRLLQQIKHLLYEEKLTIKGARQRLESPCAKSDNLGMIYAELKEIRQLLLTRF